MDEAQRAAFDEHGYFVVPNAVPDHILRELNEEYDRRVELARAGSDGDAFVRGQLITSLRKERVPTRDRHGREYSGLRHWSAAYRYLIDNPAITGILAEALSDPKWGHCPETVPEESRALWRLDHDNIHLKLQSDGLTEDKGGGLHGVPDGFHVTVVYELKDVGNGEGGFGCM
jgi:hypothetical protein